MAVDSRFTEASTQARSILDGIWSHYIESELRPAVQRTGDFHAFGHPDERNHSAHFHLDRTLDNYAGRLPGLVRRSGSKGQIATLDTNRMADELTAMRRSMEGSFAGPLDEFTHWLERHLTETLPFGQIDAVLNEARNAIKLPTPLPPVAERISSSDTQDPFRRDLMAFLRAPIDSIGQKVRDTAADLKHHAADGNFLYFLDHSPHHERRAELDRRTEAERHLHWFAVQLGAKSGQFDESLLPRLESWLYDHLIAEPLRELDHLAASPLSKPQRRNHTHSAKKSAADALDEQRNHWRAQVGNLRVEHEQTIERDGCWGTCFDVYHPYPFTGRGDVDEALSRFPVAVFLPHGFGERRPAHETPVVLAMGGIGAPYEHSGFILPMLLDMGIAVVLVESPLAGQRGLVKNLPVDLGRELRPLIDRGVPLDPPFLARLMDGVARDVRAVFGLMAERYDLVDPRRALFGISMGTLFTSFAFMRDGLGQRLLGVIGHGDLAAFARSYFAPHKDLACSLLGKVAEWMSGPLNGLLRDRFGVQDATAFIPFARLLCHVAAHPDSAREANAITFVNRVGADRPVRYLVGEHDPMCPPGDTRAFTSIVANGETEVVPGMGHDARIPETRSFLERHLADWRA